MDSRVTVVSMVTTLLTMLTYLQVSESKPRFLNVLSCNNKSWGVGDKDVDGMDQILLNKFTYIWSEVKESWIRTDQIIK